MTKVFMHIGSGEIIIAFFYPRAIVLVTDEGAYSMPYIIDFRESGLFEIGDF
jgi:hypothetical protein